MVIVAQLVRALVCGSRGRRFEPGLSPKEAPHFEGLSYFIKSLLAQHLINPARTKPTSDVYFVQNFAKIPSSKTYQHKNGKKLLDEI